MAQTRASSKSYAVYSLPRLMEIPDGPTVTDVAPALVDYYTILSLVLGGCCTNVWSYEQLLRMNPRIGSALTFSQMLFITAQTIPGFLIFQKSLIPKLKPRRVPLSQWALQVIVLTSSTLLNNWAYAYNVPLTILIVFRSAGLAISMVLGYLVLQRRYTKLQVLSVLSVSVGVVLVTLSRPSGSVSAHIDQDPPRYGVGIGMLVLSLLLTGFLGILQERTYQEYGPCWKEGLFYTHFLSLPLFCFLVPDIVQGYSSLNSSASATVAYWALVGNLFTQLLCVSGVNRLTAKVSSVSTNLVLTVRKAISLCFSVWWFGNGWNIQLGVGALMVFSGSFMFTLANRDQEKDKKD
ncbi:hypothetical protein AX16_003532 [Volvariella volvacea WC 439]|nr:hypothetical protein AX16_003532 [Volvariella volvacea WC 439]